MKAPSMTRVDVVGTIVSGAIEVALVGWWVNNRWFRVKKGQHR